VISNKEKIKRKANELGFFYCGVSKADFLEEEAKDLEKWLSRGLNGNMSYMENHFDKRLDPRILVPEAKSVVSLLLNYFPEKDLSDQHGLKVSKYAYGKDYHYVIKDKLKRLMAFINEEIGQVEGRVFVDSAPVMDKAWAKRSGLGWVGKNTNLINPKSGSFFFIAELIIDLELEADGPIKDYCGTCTKCIDACPTDALFEPYKIDASRCISYLTIELKDQVIPGEFKDKMEDWVFGCDICQDVCPWNRFSKPTKEKSFEPNEYLLNWRREDIVELTEELFSAAFNDSAVTRTKYTGLIRNIKFITHE
jgi:epoxyqueuosine reductase